MEIPVSSNYPVEFDTEDNLFVAHDALRLQLAKDYNPGDAAIIVLVEDDTFSKFPSSGIITLTEQCSDADEKALTFYYGSKGTDRFLDLIVAPGFTDSTKPKNITNVTQNITSDFHNNIKDAIIAIEEFIGVKGTTDLKPLGATMEGRINFLHRLALSPRVWFTVNKQVGLVPLEVEFTNKSFVFGATCAIDPIIIEWDFGDKTISNISIENVSNETEVIVTEEVTSIDAGSVSHSYSLPGRYDATLTITNRFGTSSLTFEDLINARIEAPDVAVITFLPEADQLLEDGEPNDGSIYTTLPVIRSSINEYLNFEIPDGRNPATDKSYGGEILDGYDNALDPITTYTWSFSDDLNHSNAKSATALYSIGGLYDLVLRADSEFGSYRITTYPNAIDIIEKTNLWLWTHSAENQVNANEFGLLSETFKTSRTTLNLNRNSDFLSNVTNSEQQTREFNRNNGFTAIGTADSGSRGLGLLYYAGGRTEAESASVEKINLVQYSGFYDSYTAPLTPTISRPWNWVAFNAVSSIYFFLGGDTDIVVPGTSPTNQTKTPYNLSTFSTDADTQLTGSSYENGAEELMENPGSGEYGDFSTYRSVSESNKCYFLRNESGGNFFRLRSFYRTEGIVSNVFQRIRKMPNLLGNTKTEGQLVSLTSGIYFFNNSGSVSRYDTTNGVWKSYSLSATSAPFRTFQDTTVSGFDSGSNTLLATSDNERRAYLSYDYSPNVFLKFNELDSTISQLSGRPDNNQWLMQTY